MGNLKAGIKTFFLLFMLFMLSACNSNQRVRADWITNWLREPVCQPPCWENIVPGETTYNQTLSLLEQNPVVFDIEEISIIPYGESLTWFLGKTPGEGTGSAIFSEDGRVKMIELRMLSSTLFLDDITSVFGDPESVILGDWLSGPGYVSTFLLYPSHKMAIGLYLTNTADTRDNARADILCDSEVLWIDFVPDMDVFDDFPEILQPVKQYEWQGCSTYP